MCCNVRMQLPLGLKRKLSFRIFAKMFSKISLRKLTKIEVTLIMWTTWGMWHKVEESLLKLAFLNIIL
jgi:hypothetical protein